jgi:hypothetical protein
VRGCKKAKGHSKTPSQSNPEWHRREAFLEWIAGLGNSDFLDVIDMVYDPHPQLHKGESYSIPHQIVIATPRLRRLISDDHRRKLDRNRQANRRLKLKTRTNGKRNKSAKEFLSKKA